MVLSKKEFIEQYCVASDIPEDELLSFSVVLECKCGEANCKGWSVVSDNALAIKAHNDLYQPKT